MKYRGFLNVVIAAVAGAVIGGVVVYSFTTYREIVVARQEAPARIDEGGAAQQGPETVRLIVAKQALGYGTTLKPENLKWAEWPKAAVPRGAFTSVEALLGEKGDQRRIVLGSVEPGEPILAGKITRFGELPPMSMNPGPGMRAVSIPIDAVDGVAGFIAAGDRVDILLTRTQQGQLVSSVILQNITVISIDRSADSEATSPPLERTVTVEVDTVQAQKLALARQVGTLSLTLRGTGAPPRMSRSLSEGMRAVSIEIDGIVYNRFGGAQSVATGDQVDIRLTRTQQGRRVTRVILQNITVIAIEEMVDIEASLQRHWLRVTVEVDTAQAQRIEAAQQAGKLSMTPIDKCPHYTRCAWFRRL